jgi:hypothetical protein
MEQGEQAGWAGMARWAREAALSPASACDPQAGAWKGLATPVAQRKRAPVSKAEKIARIVKLWRQEK